MSEVINVEEIFASKVFTRATMKERLPKNVYREVIKVMENGGELSLATADVVAKILNFLLYAPEFRSPIKPKFNVNCMHVSVHVCACVCVCVYTYV